MLFFILGCLILWTLWKLYVWHVDRELRLPGPTPYFMGLTGLYYMVKGNVQELTHQYIQYGPVLRVFVGPSAFVIVTDFESFNEVTTKYKPFIRGRLNGAAAALCPGALFTMNSSEGTDWRRHRTAMNPFFGEETLRNFVDEFIQILGEEYGSIQPHQPFNLNKFTDRVTVRFLLKTMFKVTFNQEIPEHKKKIDDASEVMGDWCGVVGISHILYPPSTATKPFRNFIDNKMLPWKSVIKDLQNDTSEDSFYGMLKDKLSWNEFEKEALGLMLAGWETTSGSLSYVLQNLSRNPEVRKKLKDEIDSVLGDNIPTYASLKSLPYLEKVVLEVLRYDTILTLFSRTTVEKGTIGNYSIPKGYQIFASPSYIAKNSVEDPDTFNPDRFTEENMKDLSKKAFTGFGMGPHVCIGKHLALLELKLATAYLIQQGNLEVDTKEVYYFPHFPTKKVRNLTAIKLIKKSTMN